MAASVVAPSKISRPVIVATLMASSYLFGEADASWTYRHIAYEKLWQEAGVNCCTAGERMLLIVRTRLFGELTSIEQLDTLVWF
jgi:hypothetical protein